MMSLPKKAVSPVIAIVLLLMMTVAAAGAAYFWLTTMQSRMQKASYKSIEKVMESTGRRVVAQATLCKPTYPYKDLVGYWMMDEGSGDYANDSSGNGNDGTLHPGSEGSITTDSEMWTDGKVGGALEFDGNDSYVNCGHVSSMETMSEFTIMTWFKVSQAVVDDPNKTSLLWKRAGTDSRLIWRTWGDGFSFVLMGGNGTDNFQTGGVPGPPSDIGGEWHFAAVTFNHGEIKGYYDGALDNTREVSMSQIVTGTSDLQIGLGKWSLRPWDGMLDEVRIYNRVLSQSAIEALYEAGKHGGRREVDITVHNIGSEEIPKATWVANLKHDGTTVETDAYNASSIGTGELKTLKFYFKNFKPNTEYKIELQGTGTSTTVSC